MGRQEKLKQKIEQVLGFQGFGFWDINYPPIMKNQMKKKMAHEMDIGCRVWGKGQVSQGTESL